jgi:hypothetical protein
METPPSYPTYTSGKFWGGTVLPFWVMMLFTAFPLTGFFGIDHLLFRSPSTALSKFLVNIFTLGMWYVYDMLQVFGDKNFVKEYGFSKPAVGPAGLALDYFRGITGSDTLGQSKSGIISILLFIGYLSTLLIPFGISNFVAGDIKGGVAKFLFSFGVWGIIWIPFFFVTGIFENFYAITDTEKVFTKGAVRPPPITLFMEGNGYSPNLMNPETLEREKAKAEKEGGLYETFVQPVLKFFGIADPKEIIDTTKCQVVPPIEKTVTAASTAAGGIMALAGTVPAIAQEATEKLAVFTDPAKLKEAAAAAAKVQTGGGLQTSTYDVLIMGGLLFLIFGGLFAAGLRKTLAQNRDERERKDDTPSKPHLL